ncbi:MAG: hypothetical protein DHS20C17_07530 [Cyclobacteriaceae bacterium]|nr:MAG: hypothetical protein DHS20C17_07530 [Cyclobacteriaceae bacterium]
MKFAALSLLMVFLLSFGLHAQKKVKEHDLKGHWKMVFDFDEDFIEQELEDQDIPWLGRFMVEGVSGFVLNILDDIDISMEFERDNKLKIIVNAFGEEEVEYAKWYIDSRGGLVLDDDDDDNDIWLFDHGKLYAYERENGHLERQPVFLKRVR